MNPTPTFDWKIFFQRVITVGIGAFLAGFSKQYATDGDLNKAIAAGLALGIAGLFGGAAYDQIRFQDSKR